MPLNPQTKILVDEILSLNATPSYEMEVDEVRRVSDEIYKLSGQPEPVAKVENRKIPGLHSDILIRIYTPKGTGIFPALVYFRGSGFLIIIYLKAMIEKIPRFHRYLKPI